MPWKTTLRIVLAMLVLALVPLVAAGAEETETTGKVETIEGCLAKSEDGTWTLTDATGVAHVVVSDEVALADHAGHRVKASGVWKGEGDARHFHVTALEHVAASCS